MECLLCHAKLSNAHGRPTRLCLYNTAKIHDPELCWTKRSDIQRLCVDSLYEQKCLGLKKKYHLAQLFRILGQAAEESDQAIIDAFVQMSIQDRYLLIENSVSALKYKLIEIKEQYQLEAFPIPDPLPIPADLPEDFQEILNSYQDKFLRRYSILLSKGHKRTQDYSRREMNIALKFVRYLAKQGYTDWLQIGETQLLRYLEDEQIQFSPSLKKFIKFAQDKKNPFKKAKSGKRKKKASVLTSTPLPKVVSKQIVKELLKQIQSEYGDTAFALAWLVCKMGLRLKEAYHLPLSRIKINKDKQCVIKPNEVWVALPGNVQSILTNLIETYYPNWQSIPDEKSQYFEIFPHYIKNLDYFGKEILQSRTNELRSSAILALMQKGYQDRITLKTAIGVSMPTVAKLECLLSVDMHRKLEPELIKARNAVILGKNSNE